WKPGTTDIMPGLATTWEVSEDGTRWTFHLHDGVKFHDGTPLDADAVVFSFKRLQDPKHPNYLALEGAYWRTLLKDVVDEVAADRLTVEIKAARPYAPLLGELAMFPIVSPSAVRRWGHEFASHPVGTGPFLLETWNLGQQLVVR